MSVLMTHRGMSEEEASAFVKSRVIIEVSQAVYMDDQVETVKVLSKILPDTSLQYSPGITIEYEYHLKPRWECIECFCYCSFATAGETVTVFISEYEDLPALDNVQVEKRNYKLTRKFASKIQQSIFGGDWSTFQCILVCYAAVGVEYSDGIARLESPAPSAIRKTGWLEHYTREVCSCATADDDGYQTDDFGDRCAGLMHGIDKWSDDSGDIDDLCSLLA